MKKSMIFVGILAIGYANAQEGNVGINTENPKATLDIQPNADNAKANAKTNEGIIAPRLTKVRIANIETPVEGTLVYATDADYTGNNNAVTKITEKGYYYYNGTEWVKVENNAGSSVQASKWTNDTVNNIIKLTNLSDGSTLRDGGNQIKITDTGSFLIGDWNDLPTSNIKLGVKLHQNQNGGFISIDGTKNTGNYAGFLVTDDKHSAFVLKNGDNATNDNTNNWQIEAFKAQGNALFVQNYLDTSNKIKLVIRGNGNVGIGGISNPSEKLEVSGKIKTSSLAQTGAGDRVVYADENGILKTGGSIATNNGVQTQSGMTCTSENAGKINYTTIQKDGKDMGVFGFCMQKGTEYVWAYMLGGSNIYGTSANGAAFGQGL